jgi:hypothetical protein
MCKCHPLIEQCQSIDKKILEKVVEERAFILPRCETLHLLQWMQKHPEQHHGICPFFAMDTMEKVDP